MALVLPILAMMVLGLMSVASMFMNYLDLTEATGSAAQHLAEIRTTSTNPCQDTYTATDRGCAHSYCDQHFAQLQFQWHIDKWRHLLGLSEISGTGRAGCGNGELSVQSEFLRG